MKRDFNLLITNLLTNEIEIIHNYSDFVYGVNDDVCAYILFFYLKKYLDNQIPFKVEFNYISLGK